MNEDTFRTNGSYIDWGTIIAGATLAVAVSVVLTQFATTVGIADMNSFRTSVDITPARIFAGGVAVLVIQLIASLLGGYIAGRMRAPVFGASVHESEVRDGIHGLLVWASATVAVVIALSIGSFMTDLVTTTAPKVEKVQEILDRQHNIALILGFAAAGTSLVSAVASWVAATKGGDHRDRSVDLSRHLSFRRNRV